MQIQADRSNRGQDNFLKTYMSDLSSMLLPSQPFYVAS